MHVILSWTFRLGATALELHPVIEDVHAVTQVGLPLARDNHGHRVVAHGVLVCSAGS